MEEGVLLRYFVLKPRGRDAYALASRDAMRQYAASIRLTNPALAQALWEWVAREAKRGKEPGDGVS